MPTSGSYISHLDVQARNSKVLLDRSNALWATISLMPDFRKLPKVDLLANDTELSSYPANTRIEAARHAIEQARNDLTAGKPLPDLVQLAISEAIRRTTPALQAVINCTGVILHTGLGRARLAAAAARQVAQIAASHSGVEFDFESGKRGDRQSIVRGLLLELTGTEDSLVVNNNAAAVFLTLMALASRKEVLLSRGQMVEIGGSFRMPDIVRQSGCKLVEVGTTNRTRLDDYDNAVSPRTAIVLRCHPSNYKVSGFTEEPSAQQLAAFAKAHGLVLVDDVGSGCLVDTTKYGLPKEPTLRDSLVAGADVVTASGDKLLGGPQCGIILGRRNVLAKIKKHPLARAVRVDKLTLAALETTLMLYINGEEDQIPTIASLSKPLTLIQEHAERFKHAYQGEALIAEGITEVGGGSLPGTGVKTLRVGLQKRKPEALMRALRAMNPPILARIEDGLVWLDPRTLNPEEVTIVETALRGLS